MATEKQTAHIMLQPNDETSVTDEGAVLTLGDHRFDCTVAVSMRLIPGPDIVFRGQFQPDGHWMSMLGLAFESPPASLTLTSSGDRADVMVDQMSAGNPTSFSARIMKGVLYSGVKEVAEEIRFSVINFPNFLSQEDAGTFRNSTVLSDSEFEVQLVPAGDGDEIYKTLKSSGGYGCTHLGTVRRSDGTGVPFETGLEALQRLHYFLSFACGAWTGIALPMGIDDDGGVKWREFGNRRMDQWGSRVSWLDRHNCQVLAPAYRGFATRWADEYSRGVLRKAIYWYLRSNSTTSGVDGGIILTQAALEYLAWTQLVESAAVLSKVGFEKLPASDRLRLLLSRLGIPLDIPPTLESLIDLAPNPSWDGPRMFTEVRNDLVHPVRKAGRFGVERLPYFEIWTLGQWYLELVLLRLIGFDGVYHDRTRPGGWVGEVRAVPWA